MKRFSAVIGLVALVVVGVFLLNIFIFVETPSGEGEKQLAIEKGTSLNGVLRELEQSGIISDSQLFKAYVVLKNAAGKIRAGEYSFSPPLKPKEVLSLLMKGDFTRHRIMIPEGWTNHEIAAHLASLNLVNPETFLSKCSDPVFIQTLDLSVPTLEGYLFPDTYEIYKPQNEEEILRRFVERFKEIYSRDFEGRARELNRSLQEVVTLASIVEKETARGEERPLIASVFLNRLQKGIPLASDPTVIYGMKDFSGNLKREDLNRPGPYNTYLNTGLPPTPIANPGADAIRAVLYPAETDYLYFVSRNDGTHQFSKTEAEHNAAVRKYQVFQRRRRAETLPTVPTVPSEPIKIIPMPETLPDSSFR